MAKTNPSRKPAKKKGFVPEAELPQKTNYLILVIGVVVVILGYFIMYAGDAVSPLSITIAPIILVIGYCIIIPLGIIYRKKSIQSGKAA